jgi:hypothetical protein
MDKVFAADDPFLAEARGYVDDLLWQAEHPRDGDRPVDPGLVAIAARAAAVLGCSFSLDVPRDEPVWVIDRDHERPARCVGIQLGPPTDAERTRQFFIERDGNGHTSVHRYRSRMVGGWALVSDRTGIRFVDTGAAPRALVDVGADGLTDDDRDLLRRLDAAMDGLITAGLTRAGEDAVLAWLHDRG